MVMADLMRGRCRSPTPDGLDGGLVLRVGHQVLRCGPDPEGPRHRHHRQHVLIVEDIVDSGPDPVLDRQPESRSPASVEICACCKPEAAKVEVDVRWVGFDIPNEFVVGYGLDYAERQYRNLRLIGTLAPHVCADARERSLSATFSPGSGECPGLSAASGGRDLSSGPSTITRPSRPTRRAPAVYMDLKRVIGTAVLGARVIAITVLMFSFGSQRWPPSRSTTSRPSADLRRQGRQALFTSDNVSTWTWRRRDPFTDKSAAAQGARRVHRRPRAESLVDAGQPVLDNFNDEIVPEN